MADELPEVLDLNALLEDIDDSGTVQYTQEGITAKRVFKCPGAYMHAVALQMMGVLIQIGDQYMIVGSESYPGFPNLRVTEVEVSRLATSKHVTSTYTSGPMWEFAQLAVTYNTGVKNDKDDDNNDSPDNIKYAVQSLDYSVEVLVLPVTVEDSVYVGMGAPGADGMGRKNVKRDVKRYIRIPTIAYDIKFEKIMNPTWAMFEDKIGKINTVPIGGGAIGTVLFEGVKADREITPAGDRAWGVNFKFIYQRHGWNNTIHPQTLKWVPAKSLDAQNDPYESTNLRDLIPAQFRRTP